MKKITLLLMAMLFFVACEGDPGPMGPPGEPGQDGVGNWKIVELTIKPEDWKLQDGSNEGELNSRFTYVVDVNEISEFVFWEGAILVYYYPNGKENIKTPLPYITHHGNVENEEELIWTETFHYDVGVGDIAFYLTYSDFATTVKPEENMEIDVVLLW